MTIRDLVATPCATTLITAPRFGANEPAHLRSIAPNLACCDRPDCGPSR